ncbi:restriction endonuclease subunit S, partial [Candidatus Uhrbacteria bacterium CG_4_10_14_0_2_um_filter_41_7]
TIYYTEINEEKIIPKFLFHYLKTVDLMKLDTGSGRPSLTQAILNQIKIPTPPLTEQKRIVSILDKFDALVNDISIGLPAELKARRQQYEYYRGKLLTFKEKEYAK